MTVHRLQVTLDLTDGAPLELTVMIKDFKARVVCSPIEVPDDGGFQFRISACDLIYINFDGVLISLRRVSW